MMVLETKTKEKPILFNSAMVRAVLDGRKTQTRRVINMPPFNPSDEELGVYAVDNLGRCPYGKVDRLWVRETHFYDPRRECFVFKADGFSENTEINWKPSIFMPRVACRILLKVEDIRVERLQDITWQDCKAEGTDWPYEDCEPIGDGSTSIIDYFISLWDGINDKRGFGWDCNPWVWVVVFSRVN
jgi:hypothetical protein